MNIREAFKKFDEVRHSDWREKCFIECRGMCFIDERGLPYAISANEIISDKWEGFKETTLLDEIKSCDFWREGYEFLETMKLINVDNYTFGDTCSIVKPQHKSFRGYVFRDKRTGKLFRSILSNLWTNSVGHSEILPLTKDHMKTEPLGVLVER